MSNELVIKASAEDLDEILKLQYLAYQSEAALFGSKDIPPLKQTLDEVFEEYKGGLFLKMTDENDVIIGSVRAHEKNGTAYIGKLMVHPDHQKKGYGKRLLLEIERYFPGKRLELFTSTRSVNNIRLYESAGYKSFAEKPVTDELVFVYMEKVKNPWEEITLSDYENHMSLDNVKQLQVMNSIMKDQFEAYPVDTAMVLGVAGGNGLEHVRTEKYKKVFGVDINSDYLKVVNERYSSLAGVLECLKIDLINEADMLPASGLVIANLLVEYIGYQAFQMAMMRVRPLYISCVIQINIDERQWVSDSPYIHAFDCLDKVHCQMEEKELTDSLEQIGYKKILSESNPLPNGKALLRLDFEMEK